MVWKKRRGERRIVEAAPQGASIFAYLDKY